MIKQHHISYERTTDKYWLILPDDTEKEVSLSQIEDIDFNKIYIEMYKLYLSNRERYEYLKNLKIETMVAKIFEKESYVAVKS